MPGSGTILDVTPEADAEGQAELESHGHQVLVCRGPGELGSCPLVEEGSCVLVDVADGVVFRLDLDDPYHREMLGCYREELGDSTPLHVVVGPGQAERYSGLLEGLPVSVGGLAPGVGALSAQASMASAVRSEIFPGADLTRRSVRRSLGVGA